MEFRCSPYHQNSAFYPIIEHLQRLLQFAARGFACKSSWRNSSTRCAAIASPKPIPCPVGRLVVASRSPKAIRR